MSAEKPSIVCRSRERCNRGPWLGAESAAGCYRRCVNSPLPSVSPIVVLDTNVVLDCLLFRNPDCASLLVAVADGRLRWIATAAMRDELAHVLSRGGFDAWHPNPLALWAAWDLHCNEVPAPAPPGLIRGPRCTDPDDQKFIDLAVARSACWLLSRDRAVLKLARRLHDLGVEVITPQQWKRATEVAL